MFKAPSDPVQLEKWRRAIARNNRTLTTDDYVCRLHFAPECIERSFDTDAEGDTKGQDHSCPKLVNGAVPNVFPNSPATGQKSSYDRSICNDIDGDDKGQDQVSPKLVNGAITNELSDFSATGKQYSSDRRFCRDFSEDAVGSDQDFTKLVDRSVPNVFSNSHATGKRSSSSRRFCVPQKIRKVVKKQVMQDDNVSATDEAGSQSLFSQLCKESDSFCPESWKSVCTSEYVCFAKLEVTSGQARITISVSISKDLDVEVFYGGLPVSHSFPARISTRDEVTTMLQQLVSPWIFAGNPSERLVDPRLVDRAATDNCAELDLGAMCYPDTSVDDR